MENVLDACDVFAGGAEVSAAEAKSLFFLTPADLRTLPSRPLGVWGCGNTRLYSTRVLTAAAVAKFGIDGLRKKKLARESREDKKRKRQEAAAEAAEVLLKAGDAAPGATATADEGSVRGLIQEARRALKMQCTWDVLRAKSAPHGTTISVRHVCELEWQVQHCMIASLQLQARIERVEQAQYAAIIGRAADPELRSLVKVCCWPEARVARIWFACVRWHFMNLLQSGAWYSVSVPYSVVFGDTSIRGSGALTQPLPCPVVCSTLHWCHRWQVWRQLGACRRRG